MIYKNFDEHITRKHGVVIHGWPLTKFDNPSAIGSGVELSALLNSWQNGSTFFRKMGTKEHMAWIEARANLEPSSDLPAEPPAISSTLLPVQNDHLDPISATNPPAHTPFIHFETPATPMVVTNLPASGSKKPRKTRSDKGKPRKKSSRAQGTNVFSASVL